MDMIAIIMVISKVGGLDITRGAYFDANGAVQVEGIAGCGQLPDK